MKYTKHMNHIKHMKRAGKDERAMARITALINQKGGVAKTSSAQALATGLALRGKRVVSLDLPGMVAALPPLPVIGVPVPLTYLDGMDSLLSIVQMPGGIPVGTLAIGKAGAINAGLLAAAILALGDEELSARLQAWRERQTDSVAVDPA